ncbi:uncharacterized protein LOC132546652 [Ylistrum balloti]|uniref:uncharacterized protein LOC132546652 n=1 Tax=Ylistrum balloti TaxID=509963 RepID=UPI002905D650|nr:uncharacterized protein LOC132546652 [Ylistrum balloti]
MGSNSLLVKAAFTAVVHVLGLLTSSQMILDDRLPFCDPSANITSECCLQYDYNATCNNTGLEGQLTLNLTEMLPTCGFSNDTTSSEEVSRDYTVVCVTACPLKYYKDGGHCKRCDGICESCTGPGIRDNCTCSLRHNGNCVQKCDEGFYIDGDSCVKCDNACKTCNASGRGIDTCNCKFELNGTCFDSCLPNMTRCDDDGDDNITVIIAAAVGGGVGVIIIVVILIVVVKCCRCRKRKSKSRMSTIIENRGAAKDDGNEEGEEEMGIRLPKQVKGRKPGKYENVTVLGGAVSTEAQQTQDKMTRYAKDPTLPRGRNLGDQPENRDSALYSNADAIKLNRNLLKGENKEQKGVFKKLKKSLKKKSSKKKEDTSESKFDVTNPGFSDGASSVGGELYCDMSGKVQDDSELDDYVDLNPKKDDEPLDDYENVTKKVKKPDGVGPQEKNKNFRTTDDEPQDEYENFGNTSRGTVIDDEPQDEYENFGSTSRGTVIDDEPQDEYENFNSANAHMDDSPYINVQHFRKEK